MTKTLIVRSARTGGHRRAGRRWTTEPQEIPADQLSEAQRQQLADDPDIVVTEGDGQDDGAAQSLAKMTKAQLAELAAAEGIDLSGVADKKDDIVAAIEAARQAGGETENSGAETSA